MQQDFWDQRYEQDEMSYGAAPNDFLREVVKQLPRGAALCLGAGEGRNAVFLAEHLGPVTAVDQSPVGLAKAATLAESKNVGLKIAVADLREFDFGEGWSVITSIWAHVPPGVRARVHAEVLRSLAPGGAYVLEAYTPAQVGRGTGGPPDPSMNPTLEELRVQLEGLDFVIGRELEREVQEGAYHNGMSSVVQVLATKP
ncbi:MAG: class I SAM-dependent methyltransferase [Myxococcota bacterium]